MTIPFHNFLETILNPEGRFLSLEGIFPVLDAHSQPVFTIYRRFYDFEMEYCKERVRLRCVISPHAIDCRSMQTGSLLFLKEMMVIDRCGNYNYFDVVLSSMPSVANAVNDDEQYEQYCNDAPVDSGGYAIAEIDGSFGLLDSGGDYSISPSYEDMEWEPEIGLVKAMEDGKWGLLTPSGDVIAPFCYQWLGSYDSGLIPAKLDDTYGYIRPDGTVAISFHFDDAYSFHDGHAHVVINGDEFEINAMGQRIVAN